jgi:hypothetical protein
VAREVLTQDKLADEESIAAGHKRRRIQGKTRFTEAVFESCGGQTFRAGAISCPKVPGASRDALSSPKGASYRYHLFCSLSLFQVSNSKYDSTYFLKFITYLFIHAGKHRDPLGLAFGLLRVAPLVLDFGRRDF